MNPLKERIQTAGTMQELDALRMACVEDRENIIENQKLFIKQKNKIKRHGGQIK